MGGAPSETAFRERVELAQRADRAARAYDRRIFQVQVSYADNLRQVMVATSDGRLLADFQPMLRFNVQCLSEMGSSRQTAVDGGGGRMGMEYFVDHTPEGIPILGDANLISQSGNFFSGDLVPLICAALSGP